MATWPQGLPLHLVHRVLSGFTCGDHGEDMRKWDRKPTLTLQAHELQGKTTTNGGSSRKVAAPVSGGQLPRQSRRADFTPDPTESNSNLFLQEAGGESYKQY